MYFIQHYKTVLFLHIDAFLYTSGIQYYQYWVSKYQRFKAWYKLNYYLHDWFKDFPATCKLMNVDIYMLLTEQLGASERLIQS